MQLTYRGITYISSANPVETIETGIIAQYRGLAYALHRPMNLPIPETKTLKYRGITYTTGNAATLQSQTAPLYTDVLPAFN